MFIQRCGSKNSLGNSCFFSAVVYVVTYFNFFSPFFSLHWASLVAQMINNLPAMQETQVPALGQEDLLEKEMATYSSVLAWRILWTEEPGRLQSMGSYRVGHNWIDLALKKAWRERRKRRRRKGQGKEKKMKNYFNTPNIYWVLELTYLMLLYSH